MKLVKDLYFPDSDSWMAYEYRRGHEQEDVLNKSFTFLSRTRTVINGGAHVGVHTKKLAQLFDEVYAFEPCKDTYKCLVENTKNNKNVTCVNKGLSCHEFEFGMGKDTRHEGNTGGNFVDPNGSGCRSVLIDSFDINTLDMILLDVEGHELYALQGAQETIRRCSPVIVVEEKARLMKRQGVAVEGVSLYLKSLGYVCVDRVNRDFIYVKG